MYIVYSTSNFNFNHIKSIFINIIIKQYKNKKIFYSTNTLHGSFIYLKKKNNNYCFLIFFLNEINHYTYRINAKTTTKNKKLIEKICRIFYYYYYIFKSSKCIIK